MQSSKFLSSVDIIILLIIRVDEDEQNFSRDIRLTFFSQFWNRGDFGIFQNVNSILGKFQLSQLLEEFV